MEMRRERERVAVSGRLDERRRRLGEAGDDRGDRDETKRLVAREKLRDDRLVLPRENRAGRVHDAAAGPNEARGRVEHLSLPGDHQLDERWRDAELDVGRASDRAEAGTR